MNRTRHLLAGVAVTLTITVGCTSPSPEPTPTPTTTAAEPTAEELDWEYTTPSPTSEGPDEVPDDSLIDEPADDDARAGAAAAATVTAEVWVQGSTLEQREWTDRLMETLTPIAQESYRDRWWGYRIPATEITGDAEVITATMASATVTVPTNAGTLTLTVTRPTPTDSWLTSGIEPPTTEN